MDTADSQQMPRLPHGIKAIRRHIKEADDVRYRPPSMLLACSHHTVKALGKPIAMPRSCSAWRPRA